MHEAVMPRMAGGQEESGWSLAPYIRVARTAVLVGIGYFVAAKVGLSLTLRPNAVSTLWPPNAILLAGFLIAPARSWWLILLAVLPAHLVSELGSGVPLSMVLCWYVSNAGEALIGAVIVRRFASGLHWPERFRGVVIFVVAAFVAAFVSSFLDVAFVFLNHLNATSYWSVWKMRFLSNTLAIVTLVPVIVNCAAGCPEFVHDARPRHYAEAALLAIGLLVVGTTVFGGLKAGPGATPALLYVPLPLLLWAAVRFGTGGASASLVLVVLIAIWGAIHGRGPFDTASVEKNALSIQLLFILLSITLLSLAALVTERERAEEAARRNGEQLQLALDAARVGIWDWNLDENSLYVDPHLKTILGYGEDEIGDSVGDWMRIVHPDDVSRLTEVVRSALAGEAPQHEVEHRMLHRDGSIRRFAAHGSALYDESGKLRRLVGTDTDVTERKRAELEAQEARRQLAHLGRVAMLGELSGAIAHELNQPLSAIMANARAAQRFLAQSQPDIPEVNLILEDIVLDDQRAGDVIVRLRALMRKEGLQLQRLSLNQSLVEVIDLLHSDLIERRVCIDTRLALSLPFVLADRVQLQQVLLNLILNACDAMSANPPGDRRITLVTERAPDDAVQLGVVDRGPGIPQGKIDHIFEPFFSSKEHGMGLGLTICRTIVEAHGGRLRAENNPEGGATFYLTLVPC